MLDTTRLIWRRWNGRHPTGIDRVCLAYLDHFGARSDAVIQHKYMRRIVEHRTSQRLFGLLSHSNSFRRDLLLGAMRRPGIPSRRGHGRFYLNIGHTGLNSPGFRRWVEKADVRPIYFVHDLIPITHPQFCRVGEANKHRARMRTILATATGVIGNSQFTLDELARFAASENLPMPPGLVAWLGSDALPSVTSQPTERPTFVILGTIEGRKNHRLLLQVWSRLVKRLGEQAPRLLIIGQRGWEADAVFDILDKDTTLRGHVMELNHCSDAEISRHLASARALLFPSAVEGYGLPLVEALQMGVPAIASDIPVFREIGGDIPAYASLDDAAAWERVIMEFAAVESRCRQDQLLRLKDFRPCTWPEHFARVEAWLNSLD